jgi:hypothetical protein
MVIMSSAYELFNLSLLARNHVYKALHDAHMFLLCFFT